MTGQAGKTEDYELEFRGVSKRFGANVALNGLSCTLHAGRIYALVGENGSGKSTLTKTLGGVVVPDRGEIVLGGRSLRPFRPQTALDSGISVVYQELLLAPDLSVLDNVYLWERRWLRPSRYSRLERDRAEEAIAALASDPPDLDQPVGTLDLGLQQVVAVARALLRRERDRCFVFDESTSALDRDEAARLLSICRELADRGRIVIFVSHRMSEVTGVSDAAIVLRNGELVGEVEGDDLSTDVLLELMSSGRRERGPGREDAVGAADRSSQAMVGRIASVRRRQADEFRLVVSGVVLAAEAVPVELEFESGTIVGLAGLDGHGQSRLLKVLAGMENHSGTVQLAFEPSSTLVRIAGVSEAVRHGVVYVPRDRKREGILPGQSVLDNFALPMWSKKFSKYGVIRPGKARRAFARFRDELQIRASSSGASIDSLSGGNQQKVILARWLAAEPRVVILDDPTRGVDHATKLDFYQSLRDLATAGVLVLLVSTELAELVALCDRVVVMRNGAVAADLPAGEQAINEASILAAMFGELHIDRGTEVTTW